MKKKNLVREVTKDDKVVVIDGDSIAYIAGWDRAGDPHITHAGIEDVYKKVDNIIESILLASEATQILGLLDFLPSFDTDEERSYNFRNDYAKTKKYKGNRGSKPEWYIIWAPVVHKRLEEFWGFQRVDSRYEVDDAVGAVVKFLIDKEVPYTIGQNDKDLMQLEGHHFNFREQADAFISKEEAHYKLWHQVLTGDPTDNITGLPGCGAKKATKVLEATKPAAYPYKVMQEYIKKFGFDTGLQKYFEAYMLVKLREDMSIDEYYLIDRKSIKATSLTADVKAFLGTEDTEELIQESLENSNFNNLNTDLFDV